jgi:hypothetical protein
VLEGVERLTAVTPKAGALDFVRKKRCQLASRGWSVS